MFVFTASIFFFVSVLLLVCCSFTKILFYTIAFDKLHFFKGWHAQDARWLCHRHAIWEGAYITPRRNWFISLLEAGLPRPFSSLIEGFTKLSILWAKKSVWGFIHSRHSECYHAYPRRHRAEPGVFGMPGVHFYSTREDCQETGDESLREVDSGFVSSSATLRSWRWRGCSLYLYPCSLFAPSFTMSPFNYLLFHPKRLSSSKIPLKMTVLSVESA